MAISTERVTISQSFNSKPLIGSVMDLQSHDVRTCIAGYATVLIPRFDLHAKSFPCGGCQMGTIGAIDFHRRSGRC
jgi:hypothetical protein